MEWIDVNDRLPDPYVNVVVFNPYEKDVNEQVTVDHMFVGLDNKLYFDWNSDPDTGELLVTHWMPLPEKPKNKT
jgi:hypothetical protein